LYPLVVGSESVPESVGDDVGGFFAAQFPHQDAAADLSALLSLVKFPDVLSGAGRVAGVGVSDHLSDEGQVGVAGEGHRSVAVDRIVAGPGEGSTLPVVGGGQRPNHTLQTAGVDVVFAVLADLPGLGAVGAGDEVDALHTVGGEHHHRFGDQHRSGPLELRSV
jgi:hypothetical protein